MSEILQKITSKFKNEKDSNSETHLQDNAIESVKTQKETEDLPESYLTDNGTPWMQTKKEPESKSEINIQGTENPKFIPEKLALEKQADVEGAGRLKGTIDQQSKMLNEAVKKSKNEVDRRAETILSMQATIDHKSRIINEVVNKSKNKVLDKVHSGFTTEELAREKQADVESQRRLKETIETKSKIDKPIVLDTFGPNKDLQNYIDTYKYDPKDIEWDQSITCAKEDSNFSDEINFISKELNKSYSHHNASYLDKITTDGDYSRFIEKELILCTS